MQYRSIHMQFVELSLHHRSRLEAKSKPYNDESQWRRFCCCSCCCCCCCESSIIQLKSTECKTDLSIVSSNRFPSARQWEGVPLLEWFHWSWYPTYTEMNQYLLLGQKLRLLIQQIRAVWYKRDWPTERCFSVGVKTAWSLYIAWVMQWVVQWHYFVSINLSSEWWQFSHKNI
jgi:hypothetical protein